METKENQKVIDAFYEKMKTVDDKTASMRLGPDKWSLKEMTGHLIDSASNNHQRFTRLQVDKEIIFPAYEAESWNRIEKSIEMPWEDLIVLWYTYNKLLLHLIEKADPSKLNHIWKKDDQDLTLEFLMNDYFRHLKWHMDLFDERLKEIKTGK